MPTLTEILAAVSQFVADNAALIGGAVVVGLATWAVSRLIRSGR